MVLLSTFLAIETMLILSIAMFIDGRREAPSIWIRSDILLGVVANVAVTLLIFSIAGAIATVMGWMQHGVLGSLHAIHLWSIALSVVFTWFVLRRLSRRLQLISVPAMASAVVAAMPQASELAVPSAGTPGTGAMAG